MQERAPGWFVFLVVRLGDFGGRAYNWLVFGKSGTFNEETTLGKDARNEDVALSPAAKKLFDELVKFAAIERFGQSPPRETTFAEIEKYGHLLGRMLARAVDEKVTANHASSHFQEEQPCPKCSEKQPPKESPHELLLQTSDGEVTLEEPAFRCPPCERDFFPGASSVEN